MEAEESRVRKIWSINYGSISDSNIRVANFSKLVGFKGWRNSILKGNCNRQ